MHITIVNQYAKDYAVTFLPTIAQRSSVAWLQRLGLEFPHGKTGHAKPFLHDRKMITIYQSMMPYESIAQEGEISDFSFPLRRSNKEMS